MGTSVNAILAFGFDLSGDSEKNLGEFFGCNEDDADYFDFDEWLCERAGIVYPEGRDGLRSEAYLEYANQGGLAVARCPVEIVHHCIDGSLMYILAVRGTKIQAYCGHPQAVNLVTPGPEKIAAMRAFCDEHKIEWQEPTWLLCSLWH